jgi:NAD-dependent SIR2 family protein deacetylase
MVYSGYRFARRAVETGKPIAIVNRGRTRADDDATLKIDADCGDVLDHVSGRYG